ncbi:butyrophilin subfamily 2 member A1-like [Megalops cyprinoides]|uniref:butyrophilin subfamily 2 member A1-like n=1 Tax=Megalops cyprinoides TaxID=118141 RepID=UPI0018642758|nr:butyrophilin subfamily 2 member A1-like [Megalops cyprinoides]
MKGDGSEYLCLILLLLQQTSVSRPEMFEILVPADPVVADAGEDVVLPCYLKPSVSAEDMRVEWVRPDSADARVNLYEDRENRNEKQIPSYRGRTALFPEELKKGNASLRLTGVRGSDDGQYNCFIQSQVWYDDASFLVRVRAVGTEPVISMEGYREGGIGLLCESKGWHPEPELIWLDSEGHSLPAGPTETLRDSMDLFIVRRSVIVQRGDTNRFTCQVLQKLFKQEKEAEFHIHAEMFHRAHPWMVAFAVFFTLAIIGLAVLIYRHVKLRRKKGLLSQQLELERVQRYAEFERTHRYAMFESACRFAVDVTLDPDTAYPSLSLSKNGKEVKHGTTWHDLPYNPKRFTSNRNVLGKEGFSSGKFYYEVQVGKKTYWTLGVAKESINRKEEITLSPENGYWTVELRNGTKYKALAGPPVSLPLSEKPRTVGVYVDYEGGQVSFYNVEARTLIYSFTGYTFTVKLYPLFKPGLYYGKNSAPLIISPLSQKHK